MLDISEYAKKALNEVSDQIVSAIFRDRTRAQQCTVTRYAPDDPILGFAGIVVVPAGGAETYLIRVALVDSLAFGEVSAEDVVDRNDIQLEWPFSGKEVEGS